MRLITIDHGNTKTSVGIHSVSKLESVIDLIDYKKESDDFILISSVANKLDLLANVDLSSLRTPDKFLDMNVNYALTLGEDRLVAAYKVFKNINPNEKILIIDSGTFTTIDLVTNNGFEGGYIFPGLQKFLDTYTQGVNLPQYSIGDLIHTSKKDDLPSKTKDAIMQATFVYLEETINGIIRKTSPSKIILTGGSSEFILKNINLKVLFELDHHLVHLGLREIHQALHPKA